MRRVIGWILWAVYNAFSLVGFYYVIGIALAHFGTGVVLVGFIALAAAELWHSKGSKDANKPFSWRSLGPKDD